MLKLRIIFIILLHLSIPFWVLSQSQKSDGLLYGKVSVDDLQMTKYLPDTSANAVVLLDNGFMTLSVTPEGWRCYLTRLHRIKILNKSAFDEYGKHVITKRGSEKLVYVMAHTISPDGSITEVKDFFNEKENKYISHKKFAFSNLQVGSIVEYEYTVKSADVFSLYPWYFQGGAPVRHSELITNFPKSLEYISYNTGKIPKQIVNFDADFQRALRTAQINYCRYTLDTLEAIKPENYVNSINNYVSSIKFQLRQTNSFWGNSDTKKILQNWGVLTQELSDDKELGKQMSHRHNYNDVWKAVKPLLNNTQSVQDKTRIIYEYISKNVAWIEDYFSIYVQESSLDDAFKKKKANSGELNMMLIACLNEAGINALPLLISTRGNGQINKEYPVIRQFNHLLCYIENGSNPLFLDAGNIYRPMGVPRESSLNGIGWVLDKNKQRWVDIPAPLSSETTLMNMDLLEDGMLKGTINSNYSGYAAVDERMSSKNDEKNERIKKEWAKLFPDVQFNNIVVTNLDSSYLPFKRVMNCTIPNAAIVVDDLIYLKPTLKTAFDENPFKAEKRNYPIELPYPISDDYVFNVSIPEGYTVEELPKDISIDLLKDGGKFIYSCKKIDDKIQLIVRIELKQLHFEVKEYENVKSFFNQIVNKKSEQIVLKKK